LVIFGAIIMPHGSMRVGIMATEKGEEKEYRIVKSIGF
jgi:hypothetical protein